MFVVSGLPLTSLSKTPRIEIHLSGKVCPEAFPIKASGNPELRLAMNNLVGISHTRALQVFCCILVDGFESHSPVD
jgi:hypothetical protein